MSDIERHRVQVTRKGLWWFEAVLEGANRDTALADLLGRFAEADGFVCTVVTEREVSRLVEVGERTHVLSRRFAAKAR